MYTDGQDYFLTRYFEYFPHMKYYMYQNERLLTYGGRLLKSILSFEVRDILNKE